MADAILLDWNMPVMNGMDFLKGLRRMDGSKQPVVVFCTTENDLKRIQEAITAGADEYIMKPFDSEIIELKFSHRQALACGILPAGRWGKSVPLKYW